ncbi:MAG: M48 family metalloprotease, partial [Dehalococcoidia bacterium]|nr:M48 family metalloprotease [Dehalococcoidia bacterium]
LSDGLARSYSPEEIEAIMAHELGHHLHRDIPRLMGVQSSLGLTGFFLSYLVLKTLGPLLGLHGLSDIGGIPLIIMTLGAFSLVMGPFVSAYIRHLERIADSRALRLTGNANAFISLMTKLADQNLNEDRPGRWAEVLFYDHPPYYKRVEQAVKFREEALRGPC